MTDTTKNCKIVYDGVDTHRGEYWYRCETCGWTDWFAGYSNFDASTAQPCKGAK